MHENAAGVCLALFLCFPAPARVAAQPPPSPDAARFVVVLDAAHGGDDMGAKLGSRTEKDATLALSVKLRSLLMARGMAVVTTRESDANVDAVARAETANGARAAACLSLHEAAASNPPTVHLFLSSLSAAKDRPLAPWRTAQSEWIPRSTVLAGVLNSALTQAGVTVTLGRTPLAAIDSMACPAVAVELELQTPSDVTDVSAFETKVTEALAAALVEWRASGDRLGDRRP